MPYRSVSKKEEERIYLDRFCAVCSDFPAGDIDDCEEPDFLVFSSNKVIGIELTKLYWNPLLGKKPEQVREYVRDLIVFKAGQLHQEQSLSPCHASIHFTDFELRKNDADRVARLVVNVVSANLPPDGKMVRIPPNSWTECTLPNELSSVSLLRLDSLSKSFYTSPQSGLIPPCSSAYIERVLADKNAKVATYRRKCDEVWLVINVGFGVLSGEFDITEDVLSAEYQSAFERVYILHQSQNQLWRLNVAT